jgi:hypothetical protein
MQSRTYYTTKTYSSKSRGHIRHPTNKPLSPSPTQSIPDVTHPLTQPLPPVGRAREIVRTAPKKNVCCVDTPPKRIGVARPSAPTGRACRSARSPRSLWWLASQKKSERHYSGNLNASDQIRLWCCSFGSSCQVSNGGSVSRAYVRGWGGRVREVFLFYSSRRWWASRVVLG